MTPVVALQVLVVDDEAPARRKILRLLRSEPGIEVVGEADSGESAIAAIEQHGPDLVFLDVQMPGADGFDVVHAMAAAADAKIPRVVFVTAHDRYALRAFEVHAFDYLLKPVGEDRFRQVLRRAREHHGRDGEASVSRLRRLVNEILKERGFIERLLIREEARAFFVAVRDISWIEADRNYLLVHCGAKTHTLRAPLDSIEAALDPKLFVRVNRGSLVGLHAVRELLPWFHGEYKVVLLDGTELRWSRRYVSRRPELLKNAAGAQSMW
jgi:two-component system LytT family response regulator